MQILHFTHCICTPAQWVSHLEQPNTIHAFWVLGMGVNSVGCPFALWTSPLWAPTTWLLSPVLYFPYTLQLPTLIVWPPAGIAATPFSTCLLAVGATAQLQLITTVLQLIGQPTHNP